MSSIIIYESKIIWGKLYRPSQDVLQKIADEIESFHPQVPIQETSGVIKFSVDKDKTRIWAKVEIDRSAFFLDDNPEVDGWENILDETIVHRLKDILFVVNLAYPGCIHVFKSNVYRDGRLLPIKLAYSSDISSWVYEECEWITFENLTIQQCWDWLVSKTNFLSFISRTPIDRALFALSYESVARDDVYIFYVMLGIEAIYNDGSNKEDSIMEQLRRKSQALLGQLPRKAIKSLNEMYGMRSKLVHGGANIYKCWPSEDYEEAEYEQLNVERRFIVTATGLLLATIQKLIKANANALSETVLIELK